MATVRLRKKTAPVPAPRRIGREDNAAREASGDPRLSIAERYKSGADYVAKVQAVVAALLADRLILPEDAETYVERARREPRVAS